jgi:hypothetical protein
MGTSLAAMAPDLGTEVIAAGRTGRRRLPAPSIVLIRRPDLPLTPAVEFFCDVLLRQQPVTAQ